MRVLLAVLALLALAALAACLPILRDRTRALDRVLLLFKRPEKPRPLGPDHYYRPYWAPGPDAAASHGPGAGSGTPRPSA